jgi:hypothetical protein
VNWGCSITSIFRGRGTLGAERVDEAHDRALGVRHRRPGPQFLIRRRFTRRAWKVASRPRTSDPFRPKPKSMNSPLGAQFRDLFKNLAR